MRRCKIPARLGVLLATVAFVLSACAASDQVAAYPYPYGAYPDPSLYGSMDLYDDGGWYFGDGWYHHDGWHRGWAGRGAHWGHGVAHAGHFGGGHGGGHR